MKFMMLAATLVLAALACLCYNYYLLRLSRGRDDEHFAAADCVLGSACQLPNMPQAISQVGGTCYVNCAANATRYMMMNKYHTPTSLISSRALSKIQNEGVGAATRGGGPYRVLLFYNAYGLLAEDAWPNSWDCAGYLLYPNPKMFSMTKAVALTFSGTDETVGAICDAIDAGCPVVFGTHISPPHIVEGNNNYYYPPPVLPVKLDCCDGHGMWIYGYNNETRRLKVMNSWGQGWSNNGTCDMSYDFYTTYKFNYYTWVIESVADKPPMPAPTSNMSYSVTVVPGTPATTNGTGDVSAGSVIVHEVKQTDIAYNDLMLFTKNKSFDLGKNLGLNANYYMSVMLLFNKLPNQPGVYVVELSAYIRPYMKLSYSLDGQTTTIDSSGGSYVERSLQFRKFDDLTIVCAAT